MRPTFTKAIRYFVTVTCRSPLRTGSNVKSMAQILRDGDDRPMLQGTSLAGAMRDWRDDVQLFGSIDNPGSLIISDIIFEDGQTVTRPRLAIDPYTGTAKTFTNRNKRGGAKFDVAALATDTKGTFQVTWRGDVDPCAAAARIEEYFSALHSGMITLGAMKTNGFGRVALDVKRRIYDMADYADLEAWLLGDEVADAEPITLAHIEDRDTVFRVNAVVANVLVKTADSSRHQNQNGKRTAGTEFKNISENNHYLIPASSLKGAVRNQISRMSPHLNRDPREQDNLFGKPKFRMNEGFAGVVHFSDGTLEEVRAVKLNRIRLSRLTGATMGRGLFADNPLDANLTFEIRLPANRKAGSAMLLYALRDLGLGIYDLGSGYSVGRGRIRKLDLDISTPAGKAKLTCADGRVMVEDPDHVIKQWQDALMGGETL